MSLFRELVERVVLWLDARFRDARREPDTAAAKCPPGCACIRCDATVPETPCEHPASLRYELDRWYCGSCGDPCGPPATSRCPRHPSWDASLCGGCAREHVHAEVIEMGMACVCDAIDASNRPCIVCDAIASALGRIED